MKNSIKRLCLISLGMIVSGAVLTVVGMLLGGFPGVTISGNKVFSPYSSSRYILPKTQIEDISGLEIYLDSFADIECRPSDDAHFYLEYSLNGEGNEPQYEIHDQILTFRQECTPAVTVMNFSFGVFSEFYPENKLTLYIPQNAAFTDFSVYHCGKLSMSDLQITAENMQLKDDYGQLSLTGFSCDLTAFSMGYGILGTDGLQTDTLFVYDSYGDCDFKNLVCREAVFELDSCDCTLTDCDIGLLTFQNEYSTTKAECLTCKNAQILLDSASMSLKADALDTLNCQISYGDFNLSLSDSLDSYDFDIVTQYGAITFPHSDIQAITGDIDEEIYHTSSGSEKQLKIRADNGDVTISEN